MTTLDTAAQAMILNGLLGILTLLVVLWRMAPPAPKEGLPDEEA